MAEEMPIWVNGKLKPCYDIQILDDIEYVQLD